MHAAAVRLATATVLALVTVSCLSAGASAARLQAAPPQITLLAPAHGSTLVSSSESAAPPAFTWRIDWLQAPAAGLLIIQVRIAKDPGFTQIVSAANYSCTVQNLNCEPGGHRSNTVYSGLHYWRVSVVGDGEATSATWAFTAVKPADRDGDGVSDARDNCPAATNPRQTDTDEDRRGDVCDPDRQKPLVRALSGSARRGQTAFFSVQVGDNYREARLLAVLSYRGHPILRGAFRFHAVRWGPRTSFYSERPLSRSLPAGIYRLCVTAWDRAGNRASSCAPYRVR